MHFMSSFLMFGFRKGNAILSSLPVASKKRKPAEEIKPAPAKRQSPNQGGCDDPDTAKPIAMHPMKEEIFCTPFSTRICAANYEEYSTPANKSATLDLFCKDQEASAHTDEVDDFRCKTDASLDLLIANSPNLDLIELASSAPVAHSGDKLLETYSSEFFQINLKIKSTAPLLANPFRNHSAIIRFARSTGAKDLRPDVDATRRICERAFAQSRHDRRPQVESRQHLIEFI